MFPRHLKNIRKQNNNVDNVVNSINPLTLTITNTLSNKHRNPIAQADCFEIDLSTSSLVEQDIVSDEVCYSCDHKTSYPTDSVVSQEIKLRIDTNFYTYYLKDPPTPLKGSSSSAISSITTPISLRNIDKTYYSVKKKYSILIIKLIPNLFF